MPVEFKFKYTNHAKERMKERRVSKEQVELTILSPDHWHYGEDGEMISAKKFGKRKVEVAYLSLPDRPKILTVISS